MIRHVIAHRIGHLAGAFEVSTTMRNGGRRRPSSGIEYLKLKIRHQSSMNASTLVVGAVDRVRSANTGGLSRRIAATRSGQLRAVFSEKSESSLSSAFSPRCAWMRSVCAGMPIHRRALIQPPHALQRSAFVACAVATLLPHLSCDARLAFRSIGAAAVHQRIAVAISIVAI